MEYLLTMSGTLMKDLMHLFLLPGLILGTLYLYLTATFDFWLKLNVPFKKPTILFGNFRDLLLFRKSQAEGVKEMYNWFPDSRFFGVFRVRSPILILRDPELIKAINVKDFSCFTNRGIPVNSQDPLSAHLFNLEGKKWKGLRSKLTPLFSSCKIKRMFYLLVECHEKFEKLIDASRGVVEVRGLAAKFSIDVIGSCAFGIQMNALTNEESEFHKAAIKLSRPSYKSTLWRMLRTSMPRFYKLLGVQVINPEVTVFFKEVVSQMIKQREEEGGKRHDFMDLLVELKNKGFLEGDYGNGGEIGGEKVERAEDIVLDENIIAAQAFVFFVAGHETSSTTIAFCLYELALNPEIQTKVREEILDAIVGTDGKLTYEAVQDIKYLDKVLLETLRKYPLAPLLSRRCEYPYKIPETDVELPAGMRVVIPVYAIHHDPQYYPSPDTFDPERFNDENKAKRHTHTFLSFGEGPRGCLGMKFALLQTKIGVISFLLHHKIEINDKTAVPIKFSRRNLVTTSETGFWLTLSSLE
ncbi:probable cytochrome P450 6a13 [Diachasma alloeum]|uniref:probable cytochrome P450 6a13 n=1 Tax=Diachasma alloeum TaxID=454923 RepID=UPI000738140C|nr:probable cytochrome P450 6a13 [Diachasma alloeum]XP_015114498.1 probable cytochrome P450 6a13 [Diachasma alloeum]XP_015114499.1 probable cytochrome P450 6a13 [Diachasma alloeum]